MKPTVMRCPDCGAQLPAGAGIIHCRFCDSAVHVGADSAASAPVPVTPRDPAPFPAEAEPRPARGRSGLVLAVSLGLLALSALGLILDEAGAGGQAEFASSFAGAERLRWDASRPLVGRVDGDEIDDVIGYVKDAANQRFVAAFSGVDGSLLWTSDAIPGLDGKSPTVHLGEGIALATGAGGDVTAYDLRDGGTRWTLRLAEVSKLFAMPDAQTVLAQLGDGTGVRIGAERGSLEPAGDSGAALAGLANTDYGANGSGTRILAPHAIGENVPQRSAFEGLAWQHVIVAQGGGFQLAVCKHAPGSPTPFLVRYAAEAGVEGERELWRAQVPGAEPLKARLPVGGTNYLHATGELAVVAYVGAEAQIPVATRLAVFDMGDGRRLWDEPIPGGARLQTIQLAGGRLYVMTTKGLAVMDGRTGAGVLSVGELGE